MLLTSLIGLAALASTAVQEAPAEPARPVPPPTPLSLAPPRGADVIGAWTVDLRTVPSDAPYTQPMHLQVDAEGKVLSVGHQERFVFARTGPPPPAHRTPRARARAHAAVVIAHGRMIAVHGGERSQPAPIVRERLRIGEICAIQNPKA